MIISALYRYYKCLAKFADGPLLTDGYSKENIRFIAFIDKDGNLKNIISHTKNVAYKKKDKEVFKEVPIEEIFPERGNNTSVVSNFAESRGKYLFGLSADKATGKFTDVIEKGGNKISLRKYFDEFVKSNEVFKDIDSPLAKAFYLFSQNWVPEDNLENPVLLDIIKDYENANFAFCLEGSAQLLNDDPKVKERWEEIFASKSSGEADEDEVMGYCSVSGKYDKIARTHDKIKKIGTQGGMGFVFVCSKDDSTESYGKQQGNVAQVGHEVMRGYTKALNYLGSSKNNCFMFDDMALLVWAETAKNEREYTDIFTGSIGLSSDFKSSGPEDDIRGTESEVKNCIETVLKGKLPDYSQLGLDEDTKFYMLGLKPNSSRLAVKLFYCNSFGNIMQNVTAYAEDIKVKDDQKIPPVWALISETVSPKSKDKSPNPALLGDFMLSILNGMPFPPYLLEEVVRRVKTDQDDEKNKFIKINDRRIGLIKGYLNRKYRINKKGESIGMALNEKSTNEAYLCGRLFAVLEKLQQDAISGISTTIKSRYFGSACSTPAMVFPRLLKLAQNHLNKLDKAGFYEKMISEICGLMEKGFPKTLSVEEQGNFILGYYHQNKDLYTKKDKSNENTVNA